MSKFHLLLVCLLALSGPIACDNATEPSEQRTGYWIEAIDKGANQYLFILRRPSPDSTKSPVNWAIPTEDFSIKAGDTILHSFQRIGRHLIRACYFDPVSGRTDTLDHTLIIGQAGVVNRIKEYSRMRIDFIGHHKAQEFSGGSVSDPKTNYGDSFELIAAGFLADSIFYFQSSVDNQVQDLRVELSPDLTTLRKLTILDSNKFGDYRLYFHTKFRMELQKAQLLVADDSTAVYELQNFTPEFKFEFTDIVSGRYSHIYQSTDFALEPAAFVQITLYR